MHEAGQQAVPSTVSGLHPAFRGLSKFAPTADSGYQLLPLRFLDLDDHRFVLTNFSGQHTVLDKQVLRQLIRHELATDHPLVDELEARQFLMRKGQGRSDVAIDLLATQYRTRLSRLADFTSLHILVVTLRCDTACRYCQVSRVSENKTAYDMTAETADLATDLVFRSPSQQLKIEFQGGEPLLNFPIVQRIIERATTTNAIAKRDLRFALCTNLAPITREMLEFCRARQVDISTSLDGPRELHAANRPRATADSYERTIRGLELAREILGPRSVSALMTTTRESLKCPEAIVDEYVQRGFDSIFVRPLSPYGFAVKQDSRIGYAGADWNEFYKRALERILELNRAGIVMREEYATIVLRRLLTPHPTGFVDLQSPTGLGISVAVYNYDGDVYLSDESRMLAEMGDQTFRVGNVSTHTYEELFYSEQLRQLVFDTMTEAIPQCATCAFQPICGTDPTFHHVTQGDAIGHRPTSAFCSHNMFVMRLLVQILEDDASSAEILRRWAY